MSLNRDRFLRTTAGAVAGLAAGASDLQAASAAGDSVFVGLCCPLTGSYGADGEDLRRGSLLVLNDLNNGTGVMKHVPSLRGKSGLLGKKVVWKVADTETNPNTAVQDAAEF